MFHSVLQRPDRREDGLGEAPAQDPLALESQTLRQDAQAPLDDSRIREDLRRGDRVAKGRADLVGALAQDALRIDRQPAALLVVEDIVVVQVAVQQQPRALRGRKLEKQALCIGDQFGSEAAVR